MTEKSIAAGLFKAHCLKLMDRVARERQPLVVTKRGRPVVKIVPTETRPGSLYGYMKDTGSVAGDIGVRRAGVSRDNVFV